MRAILLVVALLCPLPAFATTMPIEGFLFAADNHAWHPAYQFSVPNVPTLTNGDDSYSSRAGGFAYDTSAGYPKPYPDYPIQTLIFPHAVGDYFAANTAWDLQGVRPDGAFVDYGTLFFNAEAVVVPAGAFSTVTDVRVVVHGHLFNVDVAGAGTASLTFTNGHLAYLAYTLTPPTVTPEPGTWLLLITGLGMILGRRTCAHYFSSRSC